MVSEKTTTNRKYKDSVFVDLFSQDKTAPANFISLYNALHDTQYTIETAQIQNIRLENVIYTSFYNDVSFVVNDKIIVLVEHQSTINENMRATFRCLEIFATTKTRTKIICKGVLLAKTHSNDQQNCKKK